MTQLEKLIARIKSLDPSSLYEIVVYVTPEGALGFWFVEKKNVKLEGERKSGKIDEVNQAIVPAMLTHPGT